jgi:hypothetical protein
MSEEAGSPIEGSPVEGSSGSAEGTPVAPEAPAAPDGMLVTPEVQALPDWGTLRESLGDLGKDKSLESYKDLGGLVKSHIEAQKMIGNSIRLPSKDLGPEDKQKSIEELRGKLRQEGIMEAIPDTPDVYEFAVPEFDGYTPNKELIDGFKDAAHKAGISQPKASALFNWYLNHQQSIETNSQVEFETMKQSMKVEFGGLYPRKMEAARRAVAKYMGIDGDSLISSLPPAVGKKVVLAFAEIGDPMLEEGLVLGEQVQGVESRDDVRGKMEAMMMDKHHPLMDLTHPGHTAAVEEYTKLNKMLSQMV